MARRCEPPCALLTLQALGDDVYDSELSDFAAQIGTHDPVCVRGGGTRWTLGGEALPGTREVTAPVGVVAFEPAEMTVLVLAGTPVAQMHELLAESGQRTALPQRPGGTVGGALMAGESGILRYGLGPVRDSLLKARYLCADGTVATAGAGTVKNVSGFDLCRLLVSSLGTLGLLGEALLRTVPMGETEHWVRLDGADPIEVQSACRTALSILYDGTASWVLLSGYEVDIDDDLARLAALNGAAATDVEGPPELPPHRWSLTPAQAASFPGDGFVAEIGVGVVHASVPQPPRAVDAGVVDLNRRFKQRFDPTNRLNPGRDPLRRV